MPWARPLSVLAKSKASAAPNGPGNGVSVTIAVRTTAATGAMAVIETRPMLVIATEATATGDKTPAKIAGTVGTHIARVIEKPAATTTAPDIMTAAAGAITTGGTSAGGDRTIATTGAITVPRTVPAVTLDDTEITLMANVDLPQEIEAAIDNGARGVGMFRTEFLYLGYRLPTEADQLNAYRQIAEAVAPWPAVIRTLDLGGDKLTHVLDTAHEANPFLGWRGIRICLDNLDLFKTQLRALLRAGVHGDVQILLPMVSDVEEIRRARDVIEETKAELRREGTAFGEACKVGIMIEVPSAAILVAQMAAEVDFLSLGTNDLTQYTLAVDRGSAKVAQLYDPLHPAVLRLIKAVADAGFGAGIPTSICGEMAGDPKAVLLLLGLGIRILSLSPGLIPEVKEVVRVLELDHARDVASRCLELESGSAVRRHLDGTTSR